MYSIVFKNDYVWPISASDGVTISEGGGSHEFDKLGNIYFDIPGMGSLSFIDLEETEIDGFSHVVGEKGVIVRSSTREAYYRYDGVGGLKVEVDKQGTSHISTATGHLIPIRIKEFNVSPSLTILN